MSDLLADGIAYHRARMAARGEPVAEVDPGRMWSALHEACHAVAAATVGSAVREITLERRRIGHRDRGAGVASAVMVDHASDDAAAVAACAPEAAGLGGVQLDHKVLERMGVFGPQQRQPYLDRAGAIVAARRNDVLRVASALYLRGTLHAAEVAEVLRPVPVVEYR